MFGAHPDGLIVGQEIWELEVVRRLARGGREAGDEARLGIQADMALVPVVLELAGGDLPVRFGHAPRAFVDHARVGIAGGFSLFLALAIRSVVNLRYGMHTVHDLDLAQGNTGGQRLA